MPVASLIPAEPSPWANMAVAINENTNVKYVFNDFILCITICFVLHK